jgi:hypothetical protein
VGVFAKGFRRTLGFVLAVLLILAGTVGFVFAFARGGFDADIAAIGLVCAGLILGRRSLS